jgi:hypothetical protein
MSTSDSLTFIFTTGGLDPKHPLPHHPVSKDRLLAQVQLLALGRQVADELGFWVAGVKIRSAGQGLAEIGSEEEQGREEQSGFQVLIQSRKSRHINAADDWNVSDRKPLRLGGSMKLTISVHGKASNGWESVSGKQNHPGCISSVLSHCQQSDLDLLQSTS